VEEEERQAVRDKCEKRRRQDMEYEQFFTNKSIRHILGNFSFHFFTYFFLCMYSHRGLSKIIHTLNCTLILDIHCWYPMYLLRLAPQCFTFTSIVIWANLSKQAQIWSKVLHENQADHSIDSLTSNVLVQLYLSFSSSFS